MDFPIWLVLAAIIIMALICLPPVYLLRPLVIAIANRIAGKQVNTEEVKLLKRKVEILEQQVMQMQHRVLEVEDSQQFSTKMLKDVTAKADSEST